MIVAWNSNIIYKDNKYPVEKWEVFSAITCWTCQHIAVVDNAWLVVFLAKFTK